jgi:2-keto-3-deoxy-L-rhamnonate aldolase RhmA
VQPNRVKQRIRKGQLALNTYLYLTDPAVIELVGHAGFDAATIDLEHFGFDLSTVRQMIVAADLAGIVSIVRVPAGEWSLVLQVLEAGANGIQVTQVRDVSTAREAVEAVRYPPLGHRGALGSSRAARFGEVSWQEHVRSSNDEVLLIMQLESGEALDHLEDIAAVDGIDLIVIGPHDLAESMGIRTPNDERLRDAIEAAATRLGRLGKAGLGLSLGHPVLELTVDDLKRLGVVYSSLQPSVDRRMLLALQSAVKDVRDAEGRDERG